MMLRYYVFDARLCLSMLAFYVDVGNKMPGLALRREGCVELPDRQRNASLARP